MDTVNSRYLKVVGTNFYKSKLPEVQINLHFGKFGLVKKYPVPNYGLRKQWKCMIYSDRRLSFPEFEISEFEISRVDCITDEVMVYRYVHTAESLLMVDSWLPCLYMWPFSPGITSSQRWKELRLRPSTTNNKVPVHWNTIELWKPVSCVNFDWSEIIHFEGN